MYSIIQNLNTHTFEQKKEEHVFLKKKKKKQQISFFFGPMHAGPNYSRNESANFAVVGTSIQNFIQIGATVQE